MYHSACSIPASAPRNAHGMASLAAGSGESGKGGASGCSTSRECREAATPDRARPCSALLVLSLGLALALRGSVVGTVRAKSPSGTLSAPGTHGKGPVLTRLLQGGPGGIPCFSRIEKAARSKESPKPSRNPQLLGGPGQGTLPRAHEAQIQN